MKYTTTVDSEYQQADNELLTKDRSMPPITRRQLGQLIREARLARGLGLTEAAARLDIDKGYYSRIENGQNPLGKHAGAVARLYKLNIADTEAMAAADRLPKFRPYLRAMTDLPDEAIEELERHFKEVTARHKRGRR